MLGSLVAAHGGIQDHIQREWCITLFKMGVFQHILHIIPEIELMTYMKMYKKTIKNSRMLFQINQFRVLFKTLEKLS